MPRSRNTKQRNLRARQQQQQQQQQTRSSSSSSSSSASSLDNPEALNVLRKYGSAPSLMNDQPLHHQHGRTSGSFPSEPSSTTTDQMNTTTDFPKMKSSMMHPAMNSQDDNTTAGTETGTTSFSDAGSTTVASPNSHLVLSEPPKASSKRNALGLPSKTEAINRMKQGQDKMKDHNNFMRKQQQGQQKKQNRPGSFPHSASTAGTEIYSTTTGGSNDDDKQFPFELDEDEDEDEDDDSDLLMDPENKQIVEGNMTRTFYTLDDDDDDDDEEEEETDDDEDEDGSNKPQSEEQGGGKTTKDKSKKPKPTGVLFVPRAPRNEKQLGRTIKQPFKGAKRLKGPKWTFLWHCLPCRYGDTCVFLRKGMFCKRAHQHDELRCPQYALYGICSKEVEQKNSCPLRHSLGTIEEAKALHEMRRQHKIEQESRDLLAAKMATMVNDNTENENTENNNNANDASTSQHDPRLDALPALSMTVREQKERLWKTQMCVRGDTCRAFKLNFWCRDAHDPGELRCKSYALFGTCMDAARGCPLVHSYRTEKEELLRIRSHIDQARFQEGGDSATVTNSSVSGNSSSSDDDDDTTKSVSPKNNNNDTKAENDDDTRSVSSQKSNRSRSGRSQNTKNENIINKNRSGGGGGHRKMGLKLGGGGGGSIPERLRHPSELGDKALDSFEDLLAGGGAGGGGGRRSGGGGMNRKNTNSNTNFNKYNKKGKKLKGGDRNPSRDPNDVSSSSSSSENGGSTVGDATTDTDTASTHSHESLTIADAIPIKVVNKGGKGRNSRRSSAASSQQSSPTVSSSTQPTKTKEDDDRRETGKEQQLASSSAGKQHHRHVDPLDDENNNDNTNNRFSYHHAKHASSKFLLRAERNLYKTEFCPSLHFCREYRNYSWCDDAHTLDELRCPQYALTGKCPREDECPLRHSKETRAEAKAQCEAYRKNVLKLKAPKLKPNQARPLPQDAVDILTPALATKLSTMPEEQRKLLLSNTTFCPLGVDCKPHLAGLPCGQCHTTNELMCPYQALYGKCPFVNNKKNNNNKTTKQKNKVSSCCSRQHVDIHFPTIPTSSMTSSSLSGAAASSSSLKPTTVKRTQHHVLVLGKKKDGDDVDDEEEENNEQLIKTPSSTEPSPSSLLQVPSNTPSKLGNKKLLLASSQSTTTTRTTTRNNKNSSTTTTLTATTKAPYFFDRHSGEQLFYVDVPPSLTITDASPTLPFTTETANNNNTDDEQEKNTTTTTDQHSTNNSRPNSAAQRQQQQQKQQKTSAAVTRDGSGPSMPHHWVDYLFKTRWCPFLANCRDFLAGDKWCFGAHVQSDLRCPQFALTPVLKEKFAKEIENGDVVIDDVYGACPRRETCPFVHSSGTVKDEKQKFSGGRSPAMTAIGRNVVASSTTPADSSGPVSGRSTPTLVPPNDKRGFLREISTSSASPTTTTTATDNLTKNNTTSTEIASPLTTTTPHSSPLSSSTFVEPAIPEALLSQYRFLNSAERRHLFYKTSICPLLAPLCEDCVRKRCFFASSLEEIRCPYFAVFGICPRRNCDFLHMSHESLAFYRAPSNSSNTTVVANNNNNNNNNNKTSSTNSPLDPPPSMWPPTPQFTPQMQPSSSSASSNKKNGNGNDDDNEGADMPNLQL